MKKKILLITTILIIVFLTILVAGCNEVKNGKDYYLYTYDSIQGAFIKNSSKIVFDKTTYHMYDYNGQVVNVGSHIINNNTLSLIPDKIGDANQISATTAMFIYDEYIINPNEIISRKTENKAQDKSDLEGIYSNNIKLADGKIYLSSDSSNVDESYTEQIGEYKINKKKDFITFYLNSGIISIYLRFQYIDALGYKVNALSPEFYSYKKPKTDAIEVSDIELEEKIFINQSSGDGSASYSLSLRTYPNKEIVTDGVTYTIIEANNSVSIIGSSLSYKGTGSVQIEYKYGNITGKEWIYIVDIAIKPNISDNDRTYLLGDEEPFYKILNDLTLYDKYTFTYPSVEILDTTKAMIEYGQIQFKSPGILEVKLQVRHALPYKDGTNQVVDKSVNINLIINN